MSQQITKAKAALDAVKDIPIDAIINAGIQLAPLFRSVFEAFAEGFKRIGLRGKMEALIAVNEAQQEQLDKVTTELQALAARVAELDGATSKTKPISCPSCGENKHIELTDTILTLPAQSRLCCLSCNRVWVES